MSRHFGIPLGVTLLALGLIGLMAPSSRTLQVWPDRSAGVSTIPLESVSAPIDTQPLPWGVYRTADGEIARARTYMHFPLDMFPPGTDVMRATLHVHVNAASDAGKAKFGVYRALAPWEKEAGPEVWSEDPANWPDLLPNPIMITEARLDAMGPLLPTATGEATPTSRPTPRLTTTPTITATMGATVRSSKLAGHAMIQAGMNSETTAATVNLPELEIELGTTRVVSISVEDVTNLYQADMYLSFDPDLLEVVDAAPDSEDIQIRAGTFLSPDLVAENIVYQNEGEIYFSVEQLEPTEPVSGSGDLAAITFLAEEIGESALRFEEFYLTDYEGEAIATSLQNGSITVIVTETITGTPTPTPTPTLTPTGTVTPTSTPEGLPTPTQSDSPLPTPTTAPPTPTSLPPSAASVTMGQGEGTWLTWNVTALMRAWLANEVPNYGLVLASAPRPDADPEVAGDLLAAYWPQVEEPDMRPHLVVEFEVRPVTPTPTVTPAPVLPPAGGPVTWGSISLLLVGIALLMIGLATRELSK